MVLQFRHFDIRIFCGSAAGHQKLNIVQKEYRNVWPLTQTDYREEILGKQLADGMHKLFWSGRDKEGNVMPEGKYGFLIRAGSDIRTTYTVLKRKKNDE